MKKRILVTAVVSVLGASALSLLALGTPIAALGAAPPLTVCPNLPSSAPSASPTAGTEQYFACPSPPAAGQPATNHSTSGNQGSGGRATTSATAGSTGTAGSTSGPPGPATSGNPGGGGGSDRALIDLPEFGIGQMGTSGVGTGNGRAVGFLGLGGFTLWLLILLLIAIAAIVSRHRLNAMAFRMRRAVGA